jgi:predicted aconitase
VTQADIDALSAPPEVQDESGLVVFGCPQMTLAEAEEIGRHFVGKRINRRVLFHMMPDAYEAFARTELFREVERAGVEVWQHCPLAGLSLRFGLRGKQVLTPSGKLYYYLADTKYGRLEEVLRVAGVAP